MHKGTVATNRVRFQVAEVTPSGERLPCVDLKSALDRTANSKLLVCPDSAREVIRDAEFHPLIAAAVFAFRQHYPLVLSPDIIWLTILQGVAQHIQNNSENLRGRLVHHQTRLELVVQTNLSCLPAESPEMLAVAKAFCDQIARHIQADKRSLLHAEFSTTTELERLAANVVLMKAFQPYFEYAMSIVCGIPTVILEGTVADWELLETKVQALHRSDLELSWWTQHLLPLCRHFARAAQNDVDVPHWRALLKIMERYAVDDLNGWLLKFIPYVRKDRNESPIHRNPVLDLKVQEGQTGASGGNHYKITGCTYTMLPTGISSVPVTCRNRLRRGHPNPIPGRFHWSRTKRRRLEPSTGHRVGHLRVLFDRCAHPEITNRIWMHRAKARGLPEFGAVFRRAFAWRNGEIFHCNRWRGAEVSPPQSNGTRPHARLLP